MDRLDPKSGRSFFLASDSDLPELEYQPGRGGAGVTRQNLHMMIQKYGLDKAQKIYRDKKFDSFRSPRCYSFHNFSVLTSKVIDNIGIMSLFSPGYPANWLDSCLSNLSKISLKTICF